MLSFLCLPVFIILVYVSGSTTVNNFEFSTSSSSALTSKPSSQFDFDIDNRIADISKLTSLSNKPLVTTLEGFSKPLDQSTITKIRRRTVSLLPTTISLSSQTPPPPTVPPALLHPSGTNLLSPSSPLSTSSNSFLVPSTIGRAASTFKERTRTEIGAIPSTTTEIATVTASVTVPTTKQTSTYLNITSQAGTHAYLPCNVQRLVNKPVSWIRVRDGHILTVDQTTFIADQRFQSIYTQNPERWSLQIKYVQSRDAGSYECQVSTEPKMSSRVNLIVVVPKTELLGESNIHVKAGSSVALRCTITGALEPPLYINWYFDKKQIFLHKQKGWSTEIDREVVDNKSDKQNTIASLIIPSVTKQDSGNYTCSPSNSESITFFLHVLNGEYSASAITSDGQKVLMHSLTSLIIISLQFFVKI